MGFQEAVRAFFSNYVNFNDRSQRSAYWWPQLFILAVGFILGLVGGLLGETIAGLVGIIVMIFQLAVLIPTISVSVRRLHDHDKSGWWLLVAFVPILGALYLLYLFVTKGTDGPNRFGPNPLGSDSTVFN